MDLSTDEQEQKRDSYRLLIREKDTGRTSRRRKFQEKDGRKGRILEQWTLFH